MFIILWLSKEKRRLTQKTGRKTPKGIMHIRILSVRWEKKIPYVGLLGRGKKEERKITDGGVIFEKT